MKKILTAYFSLKGETYVNGDIVVLKQGNTEVIAQRLAKKIETDLFHIEKVGGYPPTYKEIVEVAKVEWKDDERPAFVGSVADMEQYDTIILGYPNWCGTMPKAVWTFLEAYDMKGKTIIPYCTHEGSGLSKSVDDIKRLCPDASVLPGTAIHGAEAREVTAEIEQILKLVSEGIC